MNHRLISASVATLAMAVCLGAPAASASAATKQPTGKAATVKTVKPSKASSLVTAARRKVLAEIARDDAVLARVLTRPGVQRLDADALTRLGQSVAADRVLLSGLADQARAAASLVELQTVSAAVAGVRPEVYHVAIGQLQDLAALALAADDAVDVLADLEQAIAEREATGADLTAARADLAAAQLLASEAVLAVPVAREAALALTATTPRGAVQAVTAEVLRIAGVLDQVDEGVLLVELALEPVLVAVPEPAV